MHSPRAESYEAELRATLPVSGLGAPLRYAATTTSTNDLALDWARESAPHGAIVVADHQSAGRGRRGRSWESPPGGSLLFSLILRPALVSDRIGLLTTAVGIAAARAAISLGADAQIKWPNDVLIAGRKVAGVLVESRLSGTTLDVVVAGVGINVALDPRDLPGEAAAQSTSLARHLDAVPSRATVLRVVLEVLGPLLDELGRATSDSIVRAAEDLSAVLGGEVRVRMGDGREISGTALRLSPAGELIVRAAGDEIVISAGEIERLRR